MAIRADTDRLRDVAAEVRDVAGRAEDAPGPPGTPSSRAVGTAALAAAIGAFRTAADQTGEITADQLTGAADYLEGTAATIEAVDAILAGVGGIFGGFLQP